MDIQKEKKAIRNLKAFYMEDWNLTEDERDDLDNLVSRIVAVVKFESKSQEQSKLKMILCNEHLEKCESENGVFNSKHQDEEPCLICLLDEEKAQAVSRDYVLVPKKPTAKMIDSTWAYDDEISLMSDNERNEFIYKKMIQIAEIENQNRPLEQK